MFVTSCETEDLTSVEDYTLLEDRDTLDAKQDICSCLELNYPVEELSDYELNSLSHMLEEEKLARDVYLALYDKWDDQVFLNISKAEQQHMDAILCLYNKYDIEDPVGDNEIGVFEDVALQSLYTTLVEQGSESLIAALLVGATIEDLDIFDLIELSIEADNEDLLAVFEELNKGSRNHMRSFISRLNQNDTNYTPQFITQELFDSIINSDRERGGSICGDSDNDGKADKGTKGKNGKKGNKGNNGNGGNGDSDCTEDGSGNTGNGNGGNSGNGGNGNGSKGNGGNGGNG